MAMLADVMALNAAGGSGSRSLRGGSPSPRKWQSDISNTVRCRGLRLAPCSMTRTRRGSGGGKSADEVMDAPASEVGKAANHGNAKPKCWRGRADIT